MVEKPEVGKTYWYCHTEILTEYPKQVKVVRIAGDVIVTDQYIGNEKFGQLSLVKEGLFESLEDANEFFIKLSLNGKIHFIEKDKRYCELYHHFVDKKPHILI